MIRLKAEFEGEDVDDLIRGMEEWITRNRRNGITDSAAATVTKFSWDTPKFREVLDRLGGLHARRFLTQLAKDVEAGQRLHNTPQLQADYGVKGGVGFAGVTGPMNFAIKNRLGRPLVQSQWEGDHASWSVDPVAARVILEKNW
jgi:hypothetical protein